MDHAAKLPEEVTAFADLVLGADPQTPVPTCPDWTLNHLFRHVGRGIRWAAQNVTDGLDGPADPKAVRDGKPPTEPAAARQWLLDGPQILLEAVARTGPDTPVWTFGGPRPAAWWIRRWVHEVAVHRADAAIAVGVDFTIPPAQAADALSEWFDLLTPRLPELGDKSVHLHATDDGLGAAGEWTLRDGSWRHEHAKGDVALRGPVADLLLLTTRRRAVEETEVQVFGADEALHTWLAAMSL
ncbi:maleylpyruvate isomerase family mycothiol-dependent enzyme [[Mycobacterium] burgundiense]|uniref:Maleylpyruvate isomerase family mycothiol-dependent enzyme n=1 Tax=[Mycobacterium] burgundiense TaxID=3064286 RepID=A0ABN9NSR2_9MYCO|nr:maleylpyruvate isomerase family mycothiol-dependent enzyme [Mycolicibacterium sp. MU0053]CAJ1509509.1 maleylpyruvate isomerase family mycothiol-dependent enzyme [Mycolicibacterium sp. MU0053]